ncbi:MAG: class I SAM-dependent methyltransferase [Verrucomicrobiia bacterium]
MDRFTAKRRIAIDKVKMSASEEKKNLKSADGKFGKSPDNSVCARMTSGGSQSDIFFTESRNLKQSWDRHSNEFLKDYLVRNIQDPRVNPQSIICRQVLIDSIVNGRFQGLKYHEILFSAAMLWVHSNAVELSDGYFRKALLYALRIGADNAEGFPIPKFIRDCFKILPVATDGLTLPNYLEIYLESSEGVLSEIVLNTFMEVWKNVLGDVADASLASALEPACGSANDFRVIHSIGLNRFINYSGFDISDKNISNARAMFPEAQFFSADIYSVDLPPHSYDIVFVHDLFEHLSPQGIDFALKKLSNCCRNVICLGFFNMDETDEHLIVPYEDYYWNRLSVKKICETLSTFELQIIHINSLFKELFNVENLYNPYAYTIIGKKVLS